MDKKLKDVNLRESEILKHNKKIDVRAVGAQNELERQLKDLGVEAKPEFKLEPPLGRGESRLCGHNS